MPIVVPYLRVLSGLAATAFAMASAVLTPLAPSVNALDDWVAQMEHEAENDNHRPALTSPGADSDAPRPSGAYDAASRSGPLLGGREVT
jgi:hypothetical protein